MYSFSNRRVLRTRSERITITLGLRGNPTDSSAARNYGVAIFHRKSPLYRRGAGVEDVSAEKPAAMTVGKNPENIPFFAIHRCVRVDRMPCEE